MKHLPKEEYIKYLKEDIAKAEKKLWDWYGHVDCPEELTNKTVEELLNIVHDACANKPVSGQPHSEIFRALKLAKQKVADMNLT